VRSFAKANRGTKVDDVLCPRVFQAVNTQDQRVAACKVVTLTLKTTQGDRKSLDKEMRVHAALKHANVLEFLTAVIVEPGTESPYIPAIYMLLEFAAGGDLFDKIGALVFDLCLARYGLTQITKAPDVGVDEEVAHFYFLQLLSGLVTFQSPLSLRSPRRLLTSAPETLPRPTSTQRACVTGISSPKTFSWMPQGHSRYPISAFARYTN